jgi:transcriptional regulator PpsR
MNQAATTTTTFREPDRYLRDLGPQLAGRLVTSSSDISLVVDEGGIIRDVGFGDERNAIQEAREWVGQPWLETVTSESRPKIHDLLATTAVDAPSRWRQVNHPSEGHEDIPVLYRVIARDEDGHAIVVGRDLRPISQLQQQLLDVQHSMERDYARLHQAETRYRMLFTLANEGILIIDADNGRVVEANPAAGRVFEKPVNKLIGQQFPFGFLESDRATVENLLAEARTAGTAEETLVRLDGAEEQIRLAATLLRREEGLFLLVRLSGELLGQGRQAGRIMLELLDRSPDAFVATDPKGHILAANPAFLGLCEVGTDLQMQDQPLSRWVGRSGVDVELLLKNLKQRSRVKRFRTTVRPEFGEPFDVELSAVEALDADPPCLGFVIRRSLRQPAPPQPKADEPLAQSLRDMTELIGRVPLRDLVRQTADIIERLCIEAALRTTNGNRASAAELLGLSRQSLYVKLRRYGLGDSSGDKKS